MKILSKVFGWTWIGCIIFVYIEKLRPVPSYREIQIYKYNLSSLRQSCKVTSTIQPTSQNPQINIRYFQIHSKPILSVTNALPSLLQ